jgi:hypothetical protein
MFRLGCPSTGKMPRSVTPRPGSFGRGLLLGQFRQRFQIGADDLDRIDAFDARDSFLDVVLNVLGEIEDDSGQLVVKLLLTARLVCPWSSPFGHSSNGFSGANNSTFENGEASLPSSGRPCWETTVRTSGCRRESRAFFSRAASPSSSESVVGMEARIQKLPSSRCGRNSLPSRGAIRKNVPREMAVPFLPPERGDSARNAARDCRCGAGSGRRSFRFPSRAQGAGRKRSRA